MLVVTRDEALRRGLSVELLAQGLGVRWLDDIAALRSALAARLPGFLILDFDPAVEPPWKELGDLRGDPATARLPAIALLGAVTAPRHIIEVMRMGIMDCVRKPCDPMVLVLRLQALRTALSRRDAPLRGGSCYRTVDGALRLDLKAHACRLSEREVRLSPKEFLLLAMLMARAGEMVSKDELLRALWPANPALRDDTLLLLQYVTRLRRKLGLLRGRLETVWGLGYRFRL
ncbi:MAG: winged helix-turn-helix domain-containing protein [Elusimicrobia bacterium]|nr:winged helix-turn-helix domain-containing protein [Elusimicrobiota bacterium]